MSSVYRKFNLFIIIVLYNRFEPAIKAINSILGTNADGFEMNIVLIDNSEISIIGKIKDYLYKISTPGNVNFSFIINSRNEGFSRAVNQGIKLALQNKADYVLLLNDDAYIDQECIPDLISALENNERALLAGPTIFYAKFPNLVWHTGGYYNKYLGKIQIPYKNKKSLPAHFKNLNVQRVDFLTGCVLLIKVEAFYKVGFFDEDLFFYGEDLDYSIRVRKSGFELLWVPYAFAWHDIEIYKGRTTPFVIYNLARSNLILIKKNFGKLYFCYYLFLIHFLLLTPYRIYQILQGSRDLKSILAWFKGTIDGLRCKI